MKDQELERQFPGSKLKAQAERIAEFVRQREEVTDWLHANQYDLVQVVSSRTS